MLNGMTSPGIVEQPDRNAVADPRELVDGGQPTDDDVVADLDMSGERGAVGESALLPTMQSCATWV